MSRKTERKIEFEIKAELNVPIPSVKRKRISEYDNFLDAFLKDEKAKTCRVIVKGKHPRSVYQAFKKRIKNKDLNIRLHLINNELYLEKT